MAEHGGKGWNRRWALGGGAAAALGLGALALRRGGKTARRMALEPNTFYRGNAAEPNTLDPSLVDAVWEMDILLDLLVGLMMLDENARPIPGMAESWTTSPDGLTWTFKLREALWSDGKPVTAEDFVFAWQRLLDPKTAAIYAYFLYLIKNAEAINNGKLPPAALGAKAIDARTIQLELVHPAPYMLEMVTNQTMLPLPRHVVEAKGKEWAQPGNYVGNGPFKLSEWVPNGHVTLVKNPRFYDADKVALEKVIFYPTDDYDAAMRRLMAGELDIQERLPVQEIDFIRANMPEMIHPVPMLITDFLCTNLKVAPFTDIRVRQAINLTINREAITQKITHIGFVSAYGLVPPNTANFPGGNVFDFKDRPLAERTAKARTLMKAAGFGPVKYLKTSLLVRNSAPGYYRAVAAALQQMFALIYIDLTIMPTDAQVFYKKIQVFDFEICWPGWSADFNDASNFLDLFKTHSGNNWGQYANPSFDAALAEAQSDIDIESRGRKLAEAEAMLMRDHAFMPLFYWVSGNLVRPYVKGWSSNNLDLHPSRWISFDQKARAALFV